MNDESRYETGFVGDHQLSLFVEFNVPEFNVQS